MGGQTGLNLAVAVSKLGVLKECNVEVLGTSIKSIEDGEDRQLFKELMEKINEPIPISKTVNDVEQANEFVKKIGFPSLPQFKDVAVYWNAHGFRYYCPTFRFSWRLVQRVNSPPSRGRVSIFLVLFLTEV